MNRVDPAILVGFGLALDGIIFNDFIATGVMPPFQSRLAGLTGSLTGMDPLMSAKPVVYFGDTTLNTAASYLAGVMTHAGIDFVYVPSARRVRPATVATERRLFIVSDYPSANFPRALQRRVVSQVERGAGLLMIGGWESFRGSDGHWAGTPLGDILPVVIGKSDDRVNCDQPALLVGTSDHPIVEGLPWDDRAPTIGGFNRFKPRAKSRVLLEAMMFKARRAGKGMAFTCHHKAPMLVIGKHGRGRTAALATDAAPHWVGGFVDWGDRRVSAQAPGGEAIEVGRYYATFFARLVRWTAGEHAD